MTAQVNLPDLAAIWIERWLKYGGGLIANPQTGGLSVSMSMDHWRWKHGERRQRVWHDGWMVGRWRELSDLMDLIPGLREAMVDHLMEHGEPYSDGSRWMARYGDHVGWQSEAVAEPAETGLAAIEEA